MDKVSLTELLEFFIIAVPLWGVWFTLRVGLRRIEDVLKTRLERMEYVLGHKLIRIESTICLEAGKTRRHTTDTFAPKPPLSTGNRAPNQRRITPPRS